MRAIPLLVALGCGGGGQSPPDADIRTTVVEVNTTRALDLLFVIDDSNSTGDHQSSLAASFPVLVDHLQNLPGGLPDLHLGVITTDMGTKTSSSATPAPPIAPGIPGGCADSGKAGNLLVNGAPVTGSFVSDLEQSDGTRVRNYTGDLAQVFSVMARVGSSGCGFEQPLAAMRAALDNNSANAGFVRPEALLAIVFLVDEDDCSARDLALFSPDNEVQGPRQSFRCTRFGVTCAVGGATPDAMNTPGTKGSCGPSTDPQGLLDPVSGFRDFLVALKGETSLIAVSGIIGNREPFAVELRTINNVSQPALAHSCTFSTPNGNQVADPAVRMQAFLDLFPNRNTTSTICQGDFSSAVLQIASLVGQNFATPCLTAIPADLDPATNGIQPDCIVEDLRGDTVTVIEPCGPVETAPCWKLVNDLECGASPLAQRLEVVRVVAPAPGTVTRMRCLLDGR